MGRTKRPDTTRYTLRFTNEFFSLLTVEAEIREMSIPEFIKYCVRAMLLIEKYDRCNIKFNELSQESGIMDKTEILASVSVDRALSFFSEYLQQTPKNNAFLCTNHSDTVESLFFDTTSKRLYCFCCGYTINLIDAIQSHKKLSLTEALNYIQDNLSEFKDINELHCETNKETILKVDSTTKQQSGDDVIYKPTGFDSLDAIYEGIAIGSVHLITGYTGHGKSTWATQLVANEAVRQGEKVFIYSGELHPSILRGWIIASYLNPNEVQYDGEKLVVDTVERDQTNTDSGFPHDSCILQRFTYRHIPVISHDCQQ